MNHGIPRLNLAINAVSLSPGGGMVVIAALAGALKAVAPEIDVTAFVSRPAVGQAIQQARPDARIEPFAEGRGPLQHFIRQQISLGPVLQRRGFDVVLSTNMLVGRCSLPQVVHHQNLLRFSGVGLCERLRTREIADAVRDIAARRALRHATINTFISRYLMKQAQRLVPGNKARNFVVLNAMNPRLLDAGIAAPEKPGTSRRLTAIQGADAHKNSGTLITAFAEIVRMRPDVPWELAIAGGGDMSAVRGLAERLNVSRRISFLGYVDQARLAGLLSGSFCLVFTSICEGFGIPPLEAMACGCPVVASDCTAIPEVVGEAGILVEPGNASAFAAAVVRLHDEPDLWADFRARGLARARQFSWERSATEMARLLHCAASGQTP
ncbi:MAG TPA: glycosyltransferase family 1 protein [Tepidisphaeraceae bacterium]|nr:glycosyltransferase family 1 protein [Tepidisphaeraceae bacterium]